MKKIALAAAMMAPTLMLAAAMPAVAQAETYNHSYYYAYYPKGSYGMGNTPFFNLTASINKLKSSKSSVVQVSKKKIGKDGTRLELKLKKPGKSTVSFKTADNTYNLKITVKKYANPFKKITVNGKNVTSKLNKKNVITLSYKKYKGKKVVVTSKTKGKWSLSENVYNTVCGSANPTGGSDAYGVKVNKKGYIRIGTIDGYVFETFYVRFK